MDKEHTPLFGADLQLLLKQLDILSRYLAPEIHCIEGEPIDLVASSMRAKLAIESQQATINELVEALEGARQFIENGIETGAIRLPDPPDPALDRLPKINAAIAKAKDKSK